MSKAKKSIREAFRKAVFERDDYSCRGCGEEFDQDTASEKLDAHHITERNEMPNGGYVVENGITLCKYCHFKAENHHALGLRAAGFSPDDLYEIIGSSREKAIEAARKT